MSVSKRAKERLEWGESILISQMM